MNMFSAWWSSRRQLVEVKEVSECEWIIKTICHLPSRKKEQPKQNHTLQWSSIVIADSNYTCCSSDYYFIRLKTEMIPLLVWRGVWLLSTAISWYIWTAAILLSHTRKKMLHRRKSAILLVFLLETLICISTFSWSFSLCKTDITGNVFKIEVSLINSQPW